MLPKMPHRVTIRSRPAASTDAVTGNDTLGPEVETVTRAYLSQQSVHLLSAEAEIRSRQDTVITTWTLIFPADVEVDPNSRVIDSDGVVYQVLGHHAERRGLSGRVQWRAVTLTRVSDLQA